MARYTGSVCKLCRRQNLKMFLKGERCFTDRCAMERRPYPPGDHGQARQRKPSDYNLQLREKQKVRRMYGLLERQFRNYFEKAEKMKGVTGENLLTLLERRLDNVAFRLGFGMTRADSRQLVRHGHIRVNGRRVNIPSFLVSSGDVVDVGEKSQKLQRIQTSLETVEGRELPDWLELDADKFRGEVKALPHRDHISMPINEQLIVELYSK